MLKHLLKFHILSASLILAYACQTPAPQKAAEAGPALVDGHPAWIMQGNIYEVNVRQYTPQGTFRAFEASLPRLKEMGVQTLWFMPINPISKLDRKGALGSYYAVSNYNTINPEFGSLADWKELVNHAHELGMKVLLDWVPNHTGADHYWLKAHPDFYKRDSATGQAIAPYGWDDVRQLDYSNRAMQDSMIASMRYWLTESNIDGYRCDVAWNVPDSFWVRCIDSLKVTHPGLLMLAEADGPQFHRDGFDITYPWTVFNKMKGIAKGLLPATSLDSIEQQIDSSYPANALKLYFTSNHDENSWNKADYGTMPGPIHAPFAVFTQTMKRSVPLIYSGQEGPFLDSISFFYKDTIQFGHYARAPFYHTLLQLRKDNPALAANASFRRLSVGNDRALYAYLREAGNNRILVILNLSSRKQQVELKDKSLWGDAVEVFAGKKETLSGKAWEMEPWGYAVFRYQEQ